jgi:hypothetical protein
VHFPGRIDQIYFKLYAMVDQGVRRTAGGDSAYTHVVHCMRRSSGSSRSTPSPRHRPGTKTSAGQLGWGAWGSNPEPTD